MNTSEIVLATLNARYIHSAFGLRYLYANMGDLKQETEILEFTIQDRPHEIAERILQRQPRIVGFGVYVWNASQTLSVLSIINRVAPDIILVVGGPEVSYELESSPFNSVADYIVTGEADVTFPELCRSLIEGRRPDTSVITSPTPKLDSICLPYDHYTSDDISHRIVYVEGSRGCPFTCEFCLSSLDIPVRQFPLNQFLSAMDTLYHRGVRHFKFVDRTFNLHLQTSKAILQFFLDRLTPGLFIHFEMVPDRLPLGLRELIAQFPAGTLQFEVGIQTFNAEVSARIARRQDYEKIRDNLTYLRHHTGVHLHVDLIIGLPGESLESFGAGFNQLVALDPHEIQVGILKRLKGTPIGRHDDEWEMVFSSDPPYDLLQNRLIDFATMQRLSRFARFWDLIANSGNFPIAKTLLLQGPDGPFSEFLRWSDWLYKVTQERHGFSVKRLATLLFNFLTVERGFAAEEAGRALALDYQHIGAKDIPPILKPYRDPDPLDPKQRSHHALVRQSKWL
jgi:radical SAM superfamily enzyme YgiQ (UPF0313 family)